MLYYTIDNTVYANRKDLKIKIGGINKYRREVKNGHVIYLADNLFGKVQDSLGINRTNIHSHYEGRQGIQISNFNQ